MIRLLLLFLIGLAVPFTFASLNKHASPAAVEVTGPAEHTYTLRGRVLALPNPPKQSLEIHHEKLPGFVSEKGEVIGMAEMAMAFGFVDPAVSLKGVKVGDPVEFTMEMRYKSKPRYLVTRLTKLPEGTQLNLGKLE